MKIIRCSDPGSIRDLEKLYFRPDCPKEIETAVEKIVQEVRENGDQAVCRFLKDFDKLELAPGEFRVTEEEFEAAEKELDETSKKSIALALDHIQDFARHQMPEGWTYSPREGVTLGEQFIPMERVGCYIPGGTAPLVSTVLHTAGIAAAAGVKEIVAATPPKRDGSIHAATLYAMKLAGVKEVYKMGGAYAIAALAYGTESVKRVDKIVGPGNAYVAAAKKMVYGKVAIDMVAGPSEIMVVADSTADPQFIAADMLSQAEHGSGLEQAVMVTDDAALPEKVIAAIEEQKKRLQRQECVERVLENGVYLIVSRNLEESLEIAGKYAPEHLELMIADAEKHASKIKAAGAIFLGPWTPEPCGDFTAGPSHVLPTGGTARFFHGLSASDFLRRSSLVQYSKEAIEKEVAPIVRFAQMEQLDAHGNSGAIRKKG